MLVRVATFRQYSFQSLPGYLPRQLGIISYRSRRKRRN